MAEGHIEFTLSGCVCGMCVCVPDSCLTHNFILHGGIKNHLAQIIIKTRRCVAYKNHVSRSKVKVSVGT